MFEKTEILWSQHLVTDEFFCYEEVWKWLKSQILYIRIYEYAVLWTVVQIHSTWWNGILFEFKITPYTEAVYMHTEMLYRVYAVNIVHMVNV